MVAQGGALSESYRSAISPEGESKETLLSKLGEHKMGWT
jgi:hypothetical protein